MNVLKENLLPTLIILLAALLVSFAVLPLQNSEWADGFRVGSESGVAEQSAEGAATAASEEPPIAGVAQILLPLVKVAAIMGIGGLLTALGLWVSNKVNRWRRSDKE